MDWPPLAASSSCRIALSRAEGRRGAENRADSASGGGPFQKFLEPFGVHSGDRQPDLEQRFRREPFEFGHHALLDLGHGGLLHGLDIREPHELARLEGRAIDVDGDLHLTAELLIFGRSACRAKAINIRDMAARVPFEQCLQGCLQKASLIHHMNVHTSSPAAGGATAQRQPASTEKSLRFARRHVSCRAKTCLHSLETILASARCRPRQLRIGARLTLIYPDAYVFEILGKSAL